jgi:type II secretory pathway component GspD/PulD (secretin)
VAAAARHAKADELHRRNFREQWQRTFDDLGTMNVPQVDSIVFDDLKRWREVSKRQPKSFKELDPLAREDKAVVLKRLGETVFTPNFGGPDDEGSPLEEIAAYLQSLTGVNFLISTRVTEDLDEEETSVSLKLPERSVKNVLDIIAETSENLRWKIEDGIVKFVTSEEMLGGQVLRFYDVRDIIHPIPDFPGREINISPSGGLAEPDEDIEEREANVVTSDLLEGLIRNNISPESWELDEANNVRITETGALVVNQTSEVHEQIDQLLADLREATGIMVDVQARFLKVEDNFLEDIGIDFRGLGQPGLGSNASFNDFGDSSTQSELGDEIGQGTDLGAFYDDGLDGDVRTRVENLYDMSLGDNNVLTGSGGLSFQWTYLNDLQLQLVMRAVSKSERIELVTAPHILVFNTARSSMSVLNQVTYVQDFDVEIAQAASIGDPMVAVIQDGVVLDVRPVVSADRRFITIELRPTIATLKRPIREMVTTLGSQNSVTIQLPEVEIQRLRTSIPMPDGGTVLLGGWKVSEHSDQRSGVPLLSKIPILSALFERKGTYVSNRKLLILLKADIIIPAEHEPTEAQLGS